MEGNATIFIVGGLNLDIAGLPKGALAPRDSAPGRITFDAGGVAYNIAWRIAAAGYPVELVTALGTDLPGDLLTRACAETNVGLTFAARVPGSSGVYLSLHEADGCLASAVCETLAVDTLTPAMLKPLLARMEGAPLVVADTNLPTATLEALAAGVSAPLLLDPVSCAKLERARGVLGYLAAIKPNLLEAEALSGERDPARAADWFIANGVGRVFISMGEKGVYYADRTERGHLPAPTVRLRNCTGAGDAMTAGIALAMLRELPVRACAEAGMRASIKHLVLRGGVLL